MTRSKDARLKLGEPLASDLADFCAANFDAPQMGIVRRAVERFIKDHLDNDLAMRRRYEDARKARLSGKDGNLRLLRRDSD